LIPTLNEFTNAIMRGMGTGAVAWQEILAALFLAMLWCIPIVTLAKYIFDGFPGQAAKRYVFIHHPGLGIMERLDRELASGHEWNIRAQMTGKFYVPRKLTDDEMTKRREVRSLVTRQTRVARMILWLLSCRPCQCFWLAGAVIVGTADAGQADVFLSAVAYGYCASLIGGWQGKLISKPAPPPAKTCGGGCKGGVRPPARPEPLRRSEGQPMNNNQKASG
jgi:hypothetical protein